MELYELRDITTNADEIELFINDSIHSVKAFGGEIPEYFYDFEVNDIYAVNDTLVICISSEDYENLEEQPNLPEKIPFENE